jgi:hypothetical protein
MSLLARSISYLWYVKRPVRTVGMLVTRKKLGRQTNSDRLDVELGSDVLVHDTHAQQRYMRATACADKRPSWWAAKKWRDAHTCWPVLAQSILGSQLLH